MTTTDAASHTTVLDSIVKLCNAAYEDTLAAEKARGLESWKARDKAKEAFMRALPNLTADTSIRAYIACIARAMSLEIVTKPEGAKLLYAAQIAMNALPKPAREAGRSGPGSQGRQTGVTVR
ncbi:hypothetical protein [Occallatibacter riparius]|uniref:Uncharacterized protein n=1 Tax=Occallatibacter riparius TaxID=1002689 RepID=A0A9J7BK24_9BACT|nr:hypothetical protein [Occallatibacter riparius]UWZ83184.1 hypothetical protein MOP44_21760 [Occallatibacter riparius]